jgi:ADP-ribosylation factor GTPase-activating protein 1
MNLQEKYSTKTAALYRDKIQQLSEGKSWSEETSSARHYKSPQSKKPKPTQYPSL